MKATIGFIGETISFWLWMLGFTAFLAILELGIQTTAGQLAVGILAIGGLFGIAYGTISVIKSIGEKGGEKE